MNKGDKILVREGCVAWCNDFNDEAVSEMTPDKQRAVIEKLAKFIPSGYVGEFVNWFAHTFVDMYGEYECDDEPCEECGDYVETWELDLNEDTLKELEENNRKSYKEFYYK